MKEKLLTCLVSALTAIGASQATAEEGPSRATLERGRYLVSIAGCNDCHTPGYPEKAGKIPESEWLTGNPVGFQGPWGTTYPANLRLVVQSMSEAQWVEHARKPTRPPMPWFALRDMSDADVKALYQYVRSLGAAGGPAPAYVQPGAQPTTPFIVFVPQNLPKTARVSK